MRFLRMLTNALAAGALGAAYLTILVLQLNPQVPLLSYSAWRWYLTMCALYGLHLALTFYVLMLVREFFSVRPFSPGWVSVRLLAWLSSAAAGVAALLMWLNLQGFAAAFSDAYARRFASGAAATTAAAVVLLGIAIAHYSFGRRGSRVGAALLLIAITGSLALPLAARGPGGEAPLGARRVTVDAARPGVASPRVIMLMLDGASLEYILVRAAEARLPNFGRLLDAGASMYLSTIRPTQPDAVWTAVATGMYPAKNGIRSAASYFAAGDDLAVDLLPDNCFSHALVQLGFVHDRPNTSASWRARPLWAILNGYGISTGIVRWPVTYPAEPIRGYMLSDRFHQLIGTMFEFDGRVAYPGDVQPIAHDAFAGSESPADPLAPPAPAGGRLPGDLSGARWDRYYSRAARALADAYAPQFSAIRYQALDIAGHYFLRYAQPSGVGTVSDADRQAYGAVLDRYYAYIDGEIGAAIDRLQPGDLLLVVSGFGMQPIGPLKHALAVALRQPDVSGAHDRAPDGFLLAYGTTVAPGRRPRGSIADVTPTVLYFLGLPIGRDMDGYARADLFDKSFTADRPITFIPSR